jgi:glycosyltransferase involved in cell wall biosynthesis/SAM-dependent methyltransferase
MEIPLTGTKPQEPTVSVVMIFLNGADFIREAIESVLSQTLIDWELLLVDDGSTDASTAVAREFADRFPQKIRYLDHPEHENRGMSASRNLGLKNARGKYLALLDVDDIFLPQKLERQAFVLDTNPEAALVYGPSLYWYGWTGKPEDLRRDKMGRLGVTPDRIYQPPQLITLYLGGGGYIPCPCAFMIRKEALEHVGGSENSFRNLYEDQVLYAKLMLNYPVYVQCEYLAKYRQQSSSACAQAIGSGAYLPGQPHQAQYVYFKWLADYIEKHHITDGTLKAALQKAMLPYEQPPVSVGQPLKARFIDFKKSIKKTLKKALRIIGLRPRDLIPAVHEINMGDMRRMTPFSQRFGIDRGGAIDRYYIEKFLAYRSGDIKGRVLEIKDNAYTRQFGKEQVSHSEILDIDNKNTKATIVADLTNAAQIPDNTFDCVILTQVLQFIYDHKAALKTIHRILKPGGVLLLTVPGITRIAYKQFGETWHWSFSEASVKRMLSESFRIQDTIIDMHGNVLTSTGLLYGMGSGELKKEEYEYTDPDYQVIITARAVKKEVL